MTKAFALLSFVVGITGDCAPPAAAAPLELKLAVSPYGGVGAIDPATASAAMRPLLLKLAQAEGLKLALRSFVTAAQVEEELSRRQIDFAAVDVPTYLRLRRTVLPVVRYEAGAPYRRISLMVATRAKLTKLEQLRGKPISISPVDTMGRIFLEVLLRRRGISAKNFFSVISQRRKLRSLVLDVAMGESIACLISDTAFSAMTRLNPGLKRQMTALHQSPPMGNALLVARTGVSPMLLAKVKRAALNIHRTDGGRQLLTILRVQRLVAATAEDYQDARKIWDEYQARPKANSSR